MRGDSCSGLRFPAEPASGPATSSVPCDPVVARRGFLGWSAGLSSRCLSNRLPPGGQWRKSIAKKQKQVGCLPAVKLFMALEAAAWTAAYAGPGSARVVLGLGHGQGGLCLPWGQQGEMDAGDPRARTGAEDASGRRRGISGRRSRRGWCGLGGISRFEPRPSCGVGVEGGVTLELQVVQRGDRVLSILPAGLGGGELTGPAPSCIY